VKPYLSARASAWPKLDVARACCAIQIQVGKLVERHLGNVSTSPKYQATGANGLLEMIPAIWAVFGLPERTAVSVGATEGIERYPRPPFSNATIEFGLGATPAEPETTWNVAAGVVVPMPKAPPVSQELPALFMETVLALEGL